MKKGRCVYWKNEEKGNSNAKKLNMQYEKKKVEDKTRSCHMIAGLACALLAD